MSRLRHFVTGLDGMKDIVGVEIGVFRGVHAEHMLEDFKELKFLHLVDPYDPRYGDKPCTQEKHNEERALAVSRLGPQAKRIKWHFKPSLEAVKDFKDASLDFVYIDGDHSIEATTSDIWVWTPKVKKGGIVAGHDYCQPIVKEAVLGIIDEGEITNDHDNWYFRV